MHVLGKSIAEYHVVGECITNKLLDAIWEGKIKGVAQST